MPDFALNPEPPDLSPLARVGWLYAEGDRHPAGSPERLDFYRRAGEAKSALVVKPKKRPPELCADPKWRWPMPDLPGWQTRAEVGAEKLRILVCGGRDYVDAARVDEVLSQYHGRIDYIVTGGAGGADELGAAWARRNRLDLIVVNADWKKHGRAAGPVRNALMLKECSPHLVVAFPGGRGTADMVRQASLAGVEVVHG